jgi:diamine N-acetyltransferase
MQFLPVSLEQVPALSQLARLGFTQTFAHLYPPEDLNAFLEQAYGHAALSAEVGNACHDWLMVWDNATPVAYLQCAPVGLPHPEANPATQGELKRLYVLQSHQGRGLGKRLMDVALEKLAARYGKAGQWIGVWSENHKAQALYTSYGFARVGEYKFAVGATLDDELIFRRKL